MTEAPGANAAAVQMARGFVRPAALGRAMRLNSVCRLVSLCA